MKLPKGNFKLLSICACADELWSDLGSFATCGVMIATLPLMVMYKCCLVDMRCCLRAGNPRRNNISLAGWRVLLSKDLRDHHPEVDSYPSLQLARQPSRWQCGVSLILDLRIWDLEREKTQRRYSPYVNWVPVSSRISRKISQIQIVHRHIMFYSASLA